MLNDQVREFLVSRGISVKTAEKCGVHSEGDYIWFPYHTEEGPRWKMRSIKDKNDQKMSMRPPDYVTPFFRQQDFTDKSHLIITEGELDAIALMQIGYTNVVSLPFGVYSYKNSFEEHKEWLDQFEVIYGCFDMDEPGRECSARATMIRKNFRPLEIPCKDANEWIMENPYSEKAEFDVFLKKATEEFCESVVHMSKLVDLLRKPINPGIPTPWENMNEVLKGFRPGELTIVSGDTGCGKTTFCIQIMYNLAIRNIAVWVNSFEMRTDVVLRKMSSFVLNKKNKDNEITDSEIHKINRWCLDTDVYINPFYEIKSYEDLENNIYFVSKRLGCKFILLDHLDYVSCLGKKKQENENISDAIKFLHNMVLEYGVHIILICHPRQTESDEVTMYQLRGSSSIKQYADNVITLRRMSRSSGKSDDKRTKVRICKNRMFGDEGAFHLYYSDTFDGFEEIDYSEIREKSKDIEF